MGLYPSMESEPPVCVTIIWFKVLQTLVPLFQSVLKAWLFFWCKTPILEGLAWDHQLVLYRQWNSHHMATAFILPNWIWFEPVTLRCKALYPVTFPLRHPVLFQPWFSYMNEPPVIYIKIWAQMLIAIQNFSMNFVWLVTQWVRCLGTYTLSPCYGAGKAHIQWIWILPADGTSKLLILSVIHKPWFEIITSCVLLFISSFKIT